MNSESNKQLLKYENFFNSFGAARLLLENAKSEKFLIEGIILYASLIDGLLRNAIILKNQIDTKSTQIDEMLISQKDKGNYYSERKIMKLALEKGVIQDTLCEKINHLYDERNKIIHRFFLTNIEYNQLIPHLNNYEIVYQEILKIVDGLECEQIEKNIGMTREGGKMTNEDKICIIGDSIKKIGSEDGYSNIS